MTREEAKDYIREWCPYDRQEEIIKALEQEPQTFKWCTNCREYDQEKHCCHRWSKAIRNTVEEMKQEYIERDVLDKIRAEIETKYGQCNLCEYSALVYTAVGDIADILQIIDKYKAESERINDGKQKQNRADKNGDA